MEKLKKNFRKNILNIIILLIFVVLELYFAQFHEHWADEAQSWLIARDNSVIEILNYTKYEGTPCLWFIIVKLFINIGFTYEQFYLIPIIFSTIGIFIFLFKFELPWYIKILFPFSFFIFFQNTIVARSYCLVLLSIEMLFLLYKNRFETPIKFWVALTFFMSISLHTYIVAGSIYAIYLYDFLKNRKYFSKNKKKICKVAIILIFLTFLVNLIIIFPDENIGFGGDGGSRFDYIIGEATISSNSIVLNVISIVSLTYFLLRYNSLGNIIKIITIFFPIIAFLTVVHCQLWHIGIIFELIFFMLLKDVNKKEMKIFILLILIINNYWNVKTIIYDYNNLYSSAEEVADFIKTIDYENKEIYGLKYMPTSIQPYFDKNIYINKGIDKENYNWSAANGDLTNDEVIENLPDICIVPVTVFPEKYEDISNKNGLEISRESNVYDVIKSLYEDEYTEYKFIDNIYIKDNIEEKIVYYVYLDNETQREMENKKDY